jgi:hypothetical protein
MRNATKQCPMNAPAVYTAMVYEFKKEWEELFSSRFPDALCNLILHATSINIMDDIITCCADPRMICNLFECICIVFLKYHVSLRLDKCSFFMERFEYVGHDINAEGNSPASSKYDMVYEWFFPSTTKMAQELRRMIRQFSKKDIPTEEWTPPIFLLFESMKTVIAHFSTSKPTFLNIDCLASGMGFILMQPDGSEESKIAMSKLKAG